MIRKFLDLMYLMLFRMNPRRFHRGSISYNELMQVIPVFYAVIDMQLAEFKLNSNYRVAPYKSNLFDKQKYNEVRQYIADHWLRTDQNLICLFFPSASQAVEFKLRFM